MEGNSSLMNHNQSSPKLFVGVAVCCFLFANVSVWIDSYQDRIPAIALASGVGIGALLLCGYRYVPAIFIGVLAHHVLCFGLSLHALTATVGTTFHATAGAMLARSFAGTPNLMDGAVSTFRMLLAVGLTASVAPVLSHFDLFFQSIGSGYLYSIWFSSSMSNMLGGIIGASLALSIPKINWVWPRHSELLRIAVVALLTIWLGYRGYLTPMVAKANETPTFPDYLIGLFDLAIFVYCGFRFGVAGTSLAVGTLACMAVWGSVHDLGPFVLIKIHDGVMVSQEIAIVAGSSALILSAAADERRELLTILQKHQKLNLRVARAARINSMGAMAAQLAHELQHPLGAISNYVNGCRLRTQNGSLTEEDLMKMLDTISNEARRSSDIIRAICSFVKKDTAEWEYLNLSAIFDSVLLVAKPELRRTFCEVEVIGADKEIIVNAEEVQLGATNNSWADLRQQP